MNIQLSQHYLLKRLSFSHCIVLEPLSKEDHLTIHTRVYFWPLYSLMLAYMFSFMLVLYCLTAIALSYEKAIISYHIIWYFMSSVEMRKCEVSSLVLTQDCFGYLRFFEISYEFKKFFIFLEKNAIQVLIWYWIHRLLG